MDLLTVHAILNLSAWGIFAPTGILLARHFRRQLGSNWVIYHLGLMLLTGLCSIAAISLALYAVNAHLVTWHQWLGAVIALAVIVQVSVGVVLYRGPLGLNTRAKLAQMHRISGILLLLLAWINITLGIFEYYGGRDKVSAWVLYGWLGLMGTWVVVGGVLEFRRSK